MQGLRSNETVWTIFQKLDFDWNVIEELKRAWLHWSPMGQAPWALMWIH